LTARIVLAAVLVVVAAIVAWTLDRRRRPAAPSQSRVTIPQQLDRNDFPRPDASWLVVLWSSETCVSCQGLFEKLTPLASDEVAVVDVEFSRHRELHKRYAIDAAPVTVIADLDGVTRASFTGAFNAPEVWSTLAELRAGA